MTCQLPLPLQFHPLQGFEEFHPGINAEAVSHIRNFGDNTDQLFIFLWGKPGLGKTHLLNACCRQTEKHGKSSAYVPLRSLITYGPEVLDGLSQLDLVAIDDIETLAGDIAWEKAAFSLFNQLRDTGRRLIVSAHQPPAILPISLHDLRSRLGWGLTLSLRPMGDDDILLAITLKASSLGLVLSETVGRFLLSHHSRSLPALTRVLERLDHATLAAQRKLTVPFLKSYLGNPPEK